MKVACFREFLGGILEAVAERRWRSRYSWPTSRHWAAEGTGYMSNWCSRSKERGLLVIADAKRGDIGSTAEAYAKAHLDVADADALTVNPYLGTDSMEPFLRRTTGRRQGPVRTGQDLQSELRRYSRPANWLRASPCMRE